ncbi:DUF2163 domain-containing protein [uncultured Pelagimonas sp.]|uniref:DUF2163 domain-containing protein n=1 Tax=uncultured Pelagimonas sp. TaxID=1618102 RepID=UPI00261D9FBE|nr:DUF2163 domain-containing protein [uncultured Pelagimonas sp.]
MSLPNDLQVHLDGRATTMCVCWRVALQNGTTFGFTNFDEEIAFDGVSYEPQSGFAPTELREGTGLEVDSHAAEGAISSDSIREEDIRAGLWDGAEVEIWRVNWADPDQRYLARLGAIGELRRGTQSFEAEMRSLAHELQQPVGRIFQPKCDAVLGDTRCGVMLGAPAEGQVVARNGARRLTISGLGGFADGVFSRGQLTWTSGANVGLIRDVLDHRAGELVMVEAPAAAIEPGDTFELQRGCDGSIDTCHTVFNNAVNFRGCPHIPPPETPFIRPSEGGANTGKVL